MLHRLALAIVAVTIATAPARADAKYTRKQNVVVDVKLSDRVKPIAPPATKHQVKPVSSDDVLVIEERKQIVYREQEEVLEQLAKETPDTEPDKADILFRLAEHYAKQSRFFRLKSIGTQVKQLQK